MILGTDSSGVTHFVLENSVTKACGSRIALCGREAMANQTVAGRENVTCDRCRQLFDGEIHLIGNKPLRGK